MSRLNKELREEQMKKYEKPMLCIERFEMTQAIAGNCTVDVNHNVDTSTCSGHPDEGVTDLGPENTPFLNHVNCGLPPTDDSYCYYPSVSDFLVFTS